MFPRNVVFQQNKVFQYNCRVCNFLLLPFLSLLLPPSSSPSQCIIAKLQSGFSTGGIFVPTRDSPGGPCPGQHFCRRRRRRLRCCSRRRTILAFVCVYTCVHAYAAYIYGLAVAHAAIHKIERERERDGERLYVYARSHTSLSAKKHRQRVREGDEIRKQNEAHRDATHAGITILLS